MTELALTWREQFERAAAAYSARGGPSIAEPSVDDEIERIFPMEPLAWSSEVMAAEAMDDLHRAALRAYTLYRLRWLSNELELARDSCRSPSEIAMLYALAITSFRYVDGVVFRAMGIGLGGDTDPGSQIEIEPQAMLWKHRVDFLLTYRRTLPADDDELRFRRRPRRLETVIVVECEGDDWRERAMVTASPGGARDREIQNSGLPVYRFTGSDIWRDPFRCAEGALDALVGRAEALT